MAATTPDAVARVTGDCVQYDRVAMARRRAPRCDTLIASAALVMLLAGWLMNFIDPKDLAARLDDSLTAPLRYLGYRHAEHRPDGRLEFAETYGQ